MNVDLDQLRQELGGDESAIAARLVTLGVGAVDAEQLAGLAVHGPKPEDARIGLDDDGAVVEINGKPVHAG